MFTKEGNDVYTIYEDINDLNLDKYKTFLNKHPNGNIFHTNAFLDIYSRSKGTDTVFIACADSKGDLLGVLLGVIQFNSNILLKPLTSRCIIWGGPIVLDSEDRITELILDELQKLISKKVIYIQFRNIYDLSIFDNAFSRTGYEKEDHLNIIVNLNKGEECLWKEIHTSRKKQIRRSINRGCIVEVQRKPSRRTIMECYNLLSSTYSNIGLPLPSMDFFIHSFDSFGNSSNIVAFLAYYKDRLIGFRFVLVFKELIYDWYAASDRDFRDKYPNDLLPWEIFRWGIRNKYSKFDFGGAGKPNEKYGVREYKSKFGGDFVNYGRYQKINKPLLYAVGKLLHRMKKAYSNI